ncbi:MAG: ribosome hibernation-promoting factor, HPF/YfiA family [bacterium JZ-2024 1]
MNLKIKGKNAELDDAVREYVQRKIDRLGRLYQRIIGDIDIEFSRQKNRVKAEGTLSVPQAVIRAEETGQGPTEAFDLLMDKLERQLRRYKKLKRERRREVVSLRQLSANAPAEAEEKEPGENFQIVRRKMIDLKPMPPEEAIYQMELLGHDFFLFLNSQTDKLNVVYRRKDGKFGLISPA